MAKRFIDTDLFRKPFMRSLEAPYKALWIYLLCECDHAGIWVVELDVAQIRMGLKLDPDKVIDKMQGAVVSIDGGSKWFLPDFVTFQYGTLNPENRVHKSVIDRLERYNLEPNDTSKNKPLTSPLQGAMDKDKDKDKEERKEAEREIEWPAWAGPNVLKTWKEFKAYRLTTHRAKYKSSSTEQHAVNLLAKYYTKGEECFDGLNLAMAKGWRFPVDPKDLAPKQPNGKPLEATTEDKMSEQKRIRLEIEERYGIEPGGAITKDMVPREQWAVMGMDKMI
jgi:hypothetical protein